MSKTYCLSILCPAFATKSKSKSPDFVDLCSENIGISKTDSVEFFKLVKFDPKSPFQERDDFIEVAVRVKNSEFSMKTIENLIQQKEKMQDQIEKLKEAVSLNFENTSTYRSENTNQMESEVRVQLDDVSKKLEKYKTK